MRDLVLELDLVDAVLERVERERAAGGAPAAELDGVEDALGREREELLDDGAHEWALRSLTRGRARDADSPAPRAPRGPCRRRGSASASAGAAGCLATSVRTRTYSLRASSTRRAAGVAGFVGVAKAAVEIVGVLGALRFDLARDPRGEARARRRPRRGELGAVASLAARGARRIVLVAGERQAAHRRRQRHRRRALSAASARAMMKAVERWVFCAASAISSAMACGSSMAADLPLGGTTRA